ncbi:MAG: hypothetical protein NWS40_05675 [Crocinitomicaceae bacterium]|jgi:hypothetical protein|nr:hypothetical protein [Crocinitomicaceae bacterium]MDP4684159.1 hypothetical protein [Crocinitomicaceae bacterium]MDP5011329.1 hypothetical protein [Crocinitomicaceae bacterium]
MIRLSFFFILFTSFVFSQKKEAFVGKLVYSVQITDTAFQKFIPATQMVVYTNDTITRIENVTDQLGKQAIIKHMELNKSYLLLETPIDNFAIQTDHTDSLFRKKESKYTFEKKWFKKKVGGVRANRLLVSHPDFKEPKEYLYLKKYSPKYINTFEDFPGLPVHYYIITMDGVYEYKLISIEEMLPPKDLFGVPSNYKRVTFNEFLDIMLQLQGGGEGE